MNRHPSMRPTVWRASARVVMRFIASSRASVLPALLAPTVTGLILTIRPRFLPVQSRTFQSKVQLGRGVRARTRALGTGTYLVELEVPAALPGVVLAEGLELLADEVTGRVGPGDALRGGLEAERAEVLLDAPEGSRRVREVVLRGRRGERRRREGQGPLCRAAVLRATEDRGRADHLVPSLGGQ